MTAIRRNCSMRTSRQSVSGMEQMFAESLLRNEVHIWTIERDRCADIARLSQCLSPPELQRARRLRVKQRRESFVYNRALVRHILASYTDLSPQCVPLTTSLEGKPLWDSASSNETNGLHFSLSHRGDQAILAVSQTRAV